jgi:Protein of unknown function (DUF1822)
MASLEALMAKSIEVPLGKEDRDTAAGFAAQAGRFAERVRRNTLAVLAANRYLSWQNIETDLTVGNSWHPALRLVADVADLQVVGLGLLECRVLAVGETEIEMPLEISEDRIAYLVLELSEKPLAGKLLGIYVPGNKPIGSIKLTELMDMDESIEYMESQLSLNADTLAKIQTQVIDVSQWFKGKLDQVSKSLLAEVLTSPLEASLARSDTRSFKEILDEIKESIEIPRSHATVSYSIGDDLTLNILCWQLENEQNKWSILSVIMSDSGREIPLQLSLQLRRNNVSLAEEIMIEEMIPYLCICATDDFSENFEISVVSNSNSKTLFSGIFTLQQDFAKP